MTAYVAGDSEAGADSESGVMFPPTDGMSVSVYLGTETLRGWLVVDRSGDSILDAEGAARIAVVPWDAALPMWKGRVTSGQLTASEAGDRPAWWDRTAPAIAAMMRSDRERDLALQAQSAAEASTVALAREHERWVDDLVEAAHDWADEGELCGDFDTFMRRQGLAARSHDFDVEVEVTAAASVYVSVEACCSEAVKDKVSTLEVKSAWREQYGIAADVEVEIDEWWVQFMSARDSSGATVSSRCEMGRLKTFRVEAVVKVIATVVVAEEASNGDKAERAVTTGEVMTAWRERYGIASGVAVAFDNWTTESARRVVRRQSV